MPSNDRRTFLKTVGVAAGATGLSGTGAVLAQQSNDNGSDDTDDGDDAESGWTTHRGNVGRTGATDASGPTPRATTDWSIDIGGKMEYTESVVVDETMFLAVRTSGYEKSEGYVVAYDAKTGEQKWKRNDLARPDTPTVADGTVYVGTRSNSDDDASYALDSETGETKWKLTEHPYSTPVVVDERVYTASESAHDAETGDIIWQKQGLSSEVFYGNGTLYYNSGTARDPEDGSAYWTDSLHNKEEHAVGDGLMYATFWGSEGTSGILAHSGDDRSRVWTYETERGGSTFNSITVGAGSIFFGEYHEGYILTALDSKTGEVQWEHELNVNNASPPTLANGVIYLGGQVPSEDDTGAALVMAVDAASGEHKWTYTFGGDDFEEYGSAAGAPVVVGERVYTVTRPIDGDWESEEPFTGTVHVLEYSNEAGDSDERTPKACIEATPSLDDLEAGDTVILETCSTCDAGEVSTREWNTDGDGEYDESGRSVEVTVPDCGSLEVTLRIATSGGDTDTASVEIAEN